MNENYVIIPQIEINVLDSTNYNYDKASLSLMFFENSQSILMQKATSLLEKSPAFVNFLESINPQKVFDVNISTAAKSMYEKGELILKYSKTKEGFLPILCDKTGKWVEQVTLNPKNISPNLSSSLNNLAMQQQLGDLMDQLEIMNNSIKRIERGQRDDRIGLYYSARQQYIEAISMTNLELQEQALLNAAKTANDSRFSLMQTMKSDIEQIIKNKKIKKHEIDELSNNIRDAMQYINESTGLCVMCFSALGETKPLLAAIKSYQCFIEQTLLSEDINGLTKAQILHQNWNGHDNEWLNLPQKIVLQLNQLITNKFQSSILISNGGSNDGNL